MHASPYVYGHTDLHTYINQYIHTHTYTYTQTGIRARVAAQKRRFVVELPAGSANALHTPFRAWDLIIGFAGLESS